MNKFVWWKLNNLRCVVKTAVALIITGSCCISSCLSAQPSAAKYIAHPLRSQLATTETQTEYRTKLVGLIADNRVRSVVKSIRSDQVVSIQFTNLLYGPELVPVPTKETSGQFMVHPHFEPTVTDHRLITCFLQALHHAYKQRGATVALATPSLRITFKRRGRLQRDPIDIDINFMYFGPEFQSVLNKVPSYLAAQLHHKMQTLDGQVREVDFATSKVTDPQKIAQITRALKQVKRNAFDVYGSTRDTFELRLLLRQGGSEEVIFVINPSVVSHLGSAILPEPLWNYYNLVPRAKAVLHGAAAGVGNASPIISALQKKH